MNIAKWKLGGALYLCLAGTFEREFFSNLPMGTELVLTFLYGRRDTC